MKHAFGLMATCGLAAGCAAIAPAGPSAVAALAPTTGNSGARIACAVVRKP